MTTRVFTYYNLKEGVSLEHFMEWSRTVDQPTCARMDSCERFEVFAVAGEINGKQTFQIIEDIDVTSWDEWQTTVASPAFAKVASEWPNYGDEASQYSVWTQKI